MGPTIPSRRGLLRVLQFLRSPRNPDQQTDLQAYMSFTDVHDRTGALPTFTLNRDVALIRRPPARATPCARHGSSLPPSLCRTSRPPSDSSPPRRPAGAAGLRLAGNRRARAGGRPDAEWPQVAVRQGRGPWRELWRVYQGVTRITGDLRLPGWLAYDAQGVFGLDPGAIYVPVPGRPDRRPSIYPPPGPPRASLCAALMTGARSSASSNRRRRMASI